MSNNNNSNNRKKSRSPLPPSHYKRALSDTVASSEGANAIGRQQLLRSANLRRCCTTDDTIITTTTQTRRRTRLGLPQNQFGPKKSSSFMDWSPTPRTEQQDAAMNPSTGCITAIPPKQQSTKVLFQACLGVVIGVGLVAVFVYCLFYNFIFSIIFMCGAGTGDGGNAARCRRNLKTLVLSAPMNLLGIRASISVRAARRSSSSCQFWTTYDDDDVADEQPSATPTVDPRDTQQAHNSGRRRSSAGSGIRFPRRHSSSNLLPSGS